MSLSDKLRSDAALLAYPALAKLLLHFYANAFPVYGIFRDELYFLACGQHLAWGYVDQPPMIAVIAAAGRALFGESLFGLRLIPALAGAAVVLLVGLIARQLGGGRFACLLAQVAALIAPVFLAIHTILSMNAFEHLFWALATYVLVRIATGAAPRLWLVFGAAIGLGLLTKHSMVFFGVAVLIGLVISRRAEFANRWLWLGGALAFLIVLPHALWQWQNNFPMWELLRNGQLYKNAPFELGAFLFGVFLEMHPLNLALIMAALWFLLLSKQGQAFRFLGWTCIALFALFMALKAKPYYVAPIYPLLYAAGGVALGGWLARRTPLWARAAVTIVMLAAGASLAPLAMPLLPPEAYIRHEQRLGLRGPANERHQMGALPQFFADMHGWPEMVAEVVRVYHTLPPEERAEVSIFTSNYGEAGAIDFFGPRHGLPRAISGHNNYFLWGPGTGSAEIVITVGESREDVEQSFEDVQEAARFSHPYAMPYEQRHPIYVARRPKFRSVADVWPRTKNYI